MRSIAENSLLAKKTRIDLTPSVVAGIGITKDIFATFTFGYAIDLNKSNTWVFYRGNQNDFNGTFSQVAELRENYLMVGLGTTFRIFKGEGE